jgi:hypothetical protein
MATATTVTTAAGPHLSIPRRPQALRALAGGCQDQQHKRATKYCAAVRPCVIDDREIPMRYSKPARLIAVMTPVLGIVLAACGGSGTPAASPSSSSSAAATAAAAAGGSAAKITADWQAFFNAKTPIAQRVRLLQNGPVFAALIRAQSGSALASTATAKVTRVSVVSPAQAKVTYSILIGGQSMLTGRAGVAVLQGGVWRVGDASFCGLLALENGGKTSSLPAACRSAG